MKHLNQDGKNKAFFLSGWFCFKMQLSRNFLSLCPFMPPLFFLKSPLRQTCFFLSLSASVFSSLFFIFQNKIRYLFLFGKYIFPLNGKPGFNFSSEGIWGEAPQQNNIMTHESGYLWRRSGYRGNFCMWVNLSFHFLLALCFGPGMTGLDWPGFSSGRRFSTKFVQWKNIFSLSLLSVQTPGRQSCNILHKVRHLERNIQFYG